MIGKYMAIRLQCRQYCSGWIDGSACYREQFSIHRNLLFCVHKETKDLLIVSEPVGCLLWCIFAKPSR